MPTDLADPIDSVAKDGFKYVINFTNDFSGSLFTYFRKENSEAVNGTKRFLANIGPYSKIKTLSFYEDVFHSGKVKRVRSDKCMMFKVF